MAKTPASTPSPTTGITFADLLERKKPAAVTVLVPLDPHLAEAFADAQTALEVARAELALRAGDAGAAAAVDAAAASAKVARAELEAECAEFRFQALGHTAFEALVEEHPPTSGQTKQWERDNARVAAMGGRLRWNPETFELALLEACAVSPRLTAGDVAELRSGNRFSSAEWDALVSAAIRVNTVRRVVDLPGG